MNFMLYCYSFQIVTLRKVEDWNTCFPCFLEFQKSFKVQGFKTLISLSFRLFSTTKRNFKIGREWVQWRCEAWRGVREIEKVRENWTAHPSTILRPCSVWLYPTHYARCTNRGLTWSRVLTAYSAVHVVLHYSEFAAVRHWWLDW